jgi:hypothetical protein
MMAAPFFARAIYTAAKFGIAHILSRGPRTAEAIANQVGVNPDGCIDCCGHWPAGEYSPNAPTDDSV